MDSVNRIPEIIEFAENKVDLTHAMDWVVRNWRREGWMRILGQVKIRQNENFPKKIGEIAES